ncbi:MAG TPA: CorA family divalent cation transporter [Vicinamibacterales bacterium]|jgi:magnesium transporter|nr:CorA family divalent cation transporter [Vicinamibacterales bacterium]
MNTIFVYRQGTTERVTRIERSWLASGSSAVLWVDLEAPSIPESLLLSDTFAFHPLAVEDALSPRERPKVEPYDGYLFIVLEAMRVFVGPSSLVTVSGGGVAAIDEMRDNVSHNPKLLGDGPLSLCHRIVDELVDGYAASVAALGGRADALAERAIDRPSPAVVRDLLALQAEAAAWRRRLAAEADVIGRLARREFIDVGTDVAFRFRDVHDHALAAGDDLTAVVDRLSALAAAGPTLAVLGRRWI